MKYRECIKCGETKPITDFPIEPRVEGYRHFICRECAEIGRELFERKAYPRKEARMPHRIKKGSKWTN